MKWCFLVIISMLSPALSGATSVITGPHWWREKPDRSSPSPPYSITGYEAWWHGKTSFSGSVIEPGCQIEMDNPWQNISFRPKEIKKISNNFFYYEMKLTLKLINCDMENSFYKSGGRIKIKLHYSPILHDDSDNIVVQMVGKKGITYSSEVFLPAQDLETGLKRVECRLRFISDKNSLINNVHKITLGVIIFQE